MAKKIKAIVRLQIPAGKATTGPPVGPSLAPHGINMMELIKAYNAATANQVGQIVPVEVTIYEDRSYTFELKTPPASQLLLRAAGIEKGSGTAGKAVAGSVTKAQVREIATTQTAGPQRPRRGSRHAGDRRHRPQHGPPGHGGLSAWHTSASATSPPRSSWTARAPILPTEALAKVKEVASAKFDETVDLAIRLGVDAKSGEQMVRGIISLPHGTGKSPACAAFARGDAEAAAREAGADEVGAEDLVQKIEGGWKDFDILVATRDMMRLVGRLGKRLGPRMPSPKAGTVGDDIGAIVKDLKAGRVQFRIDKGGILHVPIGKVSFSLEQLQENFAAMMNAVVRARPASTKGQYLRKVAISSTMGPSLLIEPSEAQAAGESI